MSAEMLLKQCMFADEPDEEEPMAKPEPPTYGLQHDLESFFGFWSTFVSPTMALRDTETRRDPASLIFGSTETDYVRGRFKRDMFER